MHVFFRPNLIQYNPLLCKKPESIQFLMNNLFRGFDAQEGLKSESLKGLS